ncbi:carbonic anhydrase [Pusillimonas sp. MFBS29]|uniref:carbonic anhydrase n=1 Tax=Pusillimonas sp. MFBS29 TaxID=2886690 RepID=UPI001D12652D|nr:carbonic anhydrase [Pusillimonas sp. MFBS29]MCC2597281.1 carbonic anhydrase [Pusillimonas sp. MFBS29]
MCELCLSRSLFGNRPASPSRRAALGALGAFSLLGMSAAAGLAHAKASPKPENVLSPDQALKRLVAGNERYTAGKVTIRSYAATRAALAGGQNPYASILSCADSRVSPELCFDEGRGDLFVTRVAGNYVTSDILASLEYGVAVLNTPLIMVLGHTSCGAVSAAVGAYEKQAEFPGHINSLVTELMPAVRAAAAEPHQGTLAQAATIENIKQNVQRLQQATPILSRAVQAGKTKVAGGLYHLDTGKVELVV